MCRLRLHALEQPNPGAGGGGRIPGADPVGSQEGITREIREETSLEPLELNLIGVYDFQRMNQVIVAYHARCEGEVLLSPELVDYRLFTPEAVKCWPGGTGLALADWLTSRGHTPQFFDWSHG